MKRYLLIDEENAKKAIEAMQKEESSLETKDVDSYLKAANDLYDSETKAILVNESYYAIKNIIEEKFNANKKLYEVWKNGELSWKLPKKLYFS